MIRRWIAPAFGLWCTIFLTMTPRGDRIMVRLGKFLFPDKLCR
jgi:hypothetical protein